MATTPSSLKPNATPDEILAIAEGRQRLQYYVETAFRGLLAREYFHLMLYDGREGLMDHT